MTSTQKIVNDESVFPTKFGELTLDEEEEEDQDSFVLTLIFRSVHADKEFPSSFESNVKRIIRLLFHVLAHIYHNHFKVRH